MIKRSAVLDIETNNLLAEMLDYSSLPYKLNSDARIWTVVVRDLKTGEEWWAENDNITAEWLEKVLKPFYYIIAHNGIKFDNVTLMLFGILEYKIGWLNQEDTVFGRECKFLDSLILSRLANPDRFGGHGLKAWGKRINDLKDDYRQQCIEAGYIKASDPKGAEFRKWNPLMLPYCKQDCKTNAGAFNEIIKEFTNHNWKQSIKQEHILANLGIRRELFGFCFDKDLAVKCVEELNSIMKSLEDKVEPILPPKPLNKTSLSFWTPPKTQVIQSGALSKHMINFLTRVGATCKDNGFVWENNFYPIPWEDSLKKVDTARMKDFDHIKMFLIDSFDWIPTEWSNRDLTKDSKKISIPIEKQIAALDRWWNDTTEGKYTKGRMRELGMNLDSAYDKLKDKLGGKWPVRVPTSPKIRVGVEKELCPNLIKLGDKVQFAKDFADWLTYRHRRNSIAGGDISDLNLYEEEPTSGFLSCYREVDGRIPTPAIEIGAVTNRYTHISIANIARPSSIYGKELRSLFRAGEGGVFFGFDYASLEARIMAHYVHKYPGGIELGNLFTGEKPNDWHSSQAIAMGIDRGSAKSVDYGLLYGAQIKKIMQMLNVSKERAEEIYNLFWDNSPALKELRDAVIKFWESTGKKYVIGLDGRKINVRSKHALLNSLFQSAGIIYAKYVSIMIMEEYEKNGLCIDPFIGTPDVTSMIEYHDEQAMYLKPKYLQFKVFNTKEEAKEFVANWEGGQLSAISEGKGKFYIVMPSNISTIIEDKMLEAEKMLNIKVPMGFEYMVGNTWYECH